jgi:hypothetical protein
MKLDLTDDEALVLFEWLSREDKRSAIPVEDPSEKTVLWSIHCQLEKALVQPFKKDYATLVAEARHRVSSG